jgi:hypothetical protein
VQIVLNEAALSGASPQAKPQSRVPVRHAENFMEGQRLQVRWFDLLRPGENQTGAMLRLRELGESGDDLGTRVRRIAHGFVAGTAGSRLLLWLLLSDYTPKTLVLHLHRGHEMV